jgi:hypothetical protein
VKGREDSKRKVMTERRHGNVGKIGKDDGSCSAGLASEASRERVLAL